MTSDKSGLDAEAEDLTPESVANRGEACPLVIANTILDCDVLAQVSRICASELRHLQRQLAAESGAKQKEALTSIDVQVKAYIDKLHEACKRGLDWRTAEKRILREMEGLAGQLRAFLDVNGGLQSWQESIVMNSLDSEVLRPELQVEAGKEASPGNEQIGGLLNDIRAEMVKGPSIAPKVVDSFGGPPQKSKPSKEETFTSTADIRELERRIIALQSNLRQATDNIEGDIRGSVRREVVHLRESHSKMRSLMSEIDQGDLTFWETPTEGEKRLIMAPRSPMEEFLEEASKAVGAVIEPPKSPEGEAALLYLIERREKGLLNVDDSGILEALQRRLRSQALISSRRSEGGSIRGPSIMELAAVGCGRYPRGMSAAATLLTECENALSAAISKAWDELNCAELQRKEMALTEDLTSFQKRRRAVAHMSRQREEARRHTHTLWRLLEESSNALNCFRGISEEHMVSIERAIIVAARLKT